MLGKKAELLPFVCPKCGSSKGITQCYLEWRVNDVVGITKEHDIIIEWQSSESRDVNPNHKITVEFVPNVKPDLEHFHCSKCQWNWVDNRNCEDASPFI
jgi:hypothetical protein